MDVASNGFSFDALTQREFGTSRTEVDLKRINHPFQFLNENVIYLFRFFLKR